MKILWVSLVKFPPLCSYLGEEAPAHCGWMYFIGKGNADGDARGTVGSHRLFIRKEI